MSTQYIGAGIEGRDVGGVGLGVVMSSSLSSSVVSSSSSSSSPGCPVGLFPAWPPSAVSSDELVADDVVSNSDWSSSSESVLVLRTAPAVLNDFVKYFIG